VPIKVLRTPKEKNMTVQIAKIMLVQHRQDYNRDRLAWLPSRLYRSWREALPKVQETIRSL
jgi:hypothetical protein